MQLQPSYIMQMRQYSFALRQRLCSCLIRPVWIFFRPFLMLISSFEGIKWYQMSEQAALCFRTPLKLGQKTSKNKLCTGPRQWHGTDWLIKSGLSSDFTGGGGGEIRGVLCGISSLWYQENCQKSLCSLRVTGAKRKEAAAAGEVRKADERTFSE